MLASKGHFVSPPTTVEVGTALSELGLDLQPLTGQRNKKNKRRFSDQQIKSLEFIYESESRPESLTKHQLANELGLHPRQVAIWFQNRRARSKTKDIERDYSVLKANYDSLLSDFDSLKRENQSLLAQLQKLNNMLAQSQRNTYQERDHPGYTNDGKSDHGNSTTKLPDLPRIAVESCDYDSNIIVPMSDDNSREMDSTGEDINRLDNVDPADGSVSSSQNWCSLESNGFLVESNCDSQWWDFWS